MKLEMKNGCFSYDGKTNILNNINLEIDHNTIVSVLGQNGVGKTTFLKCLLGIFKLNSGEIYLDGSKVDQILNKKEVAYVPQAGKTNLPYRVNDLVLMGRTKLIPQFSMPKKIDEEKSKIAMEEVGIYHLKDRKCTELSGGQLQMVYLARAIAGESQLIILDEPEAHLDFKNQKIILDKILNLSKSKGISCIINTHSPENAMSISDYTLFLGKDSYEYGLTEEILNEENIEVYFGMKSKILDLKSMGINKKTFVLLD